MAKIIASRTAQYLLTAEYVLNYTDWCIDAATGTKKTLGSTVALSSDPSEASLASGKNGVVTIPMFSMPQGAVVVGGAIDIKTAFVGPTATLSIGKSGATTAFVSGLDVAATTNSAFTVTTTVPFTSEDGTNLIGTLTLSNADATAGKVYVYIQYYIVGRGNEVSAA
jgi:hypothetical protein